MLKNKNKIPQHVAIIMDGNRRWAKKNGLELIKGHKKVVDDMIERLVDQCIKKGVKYLTLWAFSTENWKRDQKEVAGIMNLFDIAFATTSKTLAEKDAKINVIGDTSRFSDRIQHGIKAWLEETKKNKTITVTFALNYGGRDEILRASSKFLKKVLKDDVYRQEILRKIKTGDDKRLINEETFTQFLDTADLPAPDLVIRSGGEKRLSGFLAWQAIYSELYFSDVLMPDFDEKQLDLALEEFAKRQRRFGK